MDTNMFAARSIRLLALGAAGALLGACALIDPEAQSDAARMLVGAGTPTPVAGETVAVGTSREDAADDPEIWADPRDASRVVIFGTDKKAGLYTYDLSGKITGFIPDGLLNNVDLRDGFPTPDGDRVLVAASDRGRGGFALYLMDPDTLAVANWGVVKLDLDEPYGLCVGRRGEAFVVIVNGTDGQVRQTRVSAGADGKPVTVEERRFAVGSQTEGCVVDDQKGDLYIGEEAKGIWRYRLDPAAGDGRVAFATAPSEMLKPDVEGLTLLREGAETYLIASSQGDSAFAVWRVDGDEPAYKGRWSGVAAGGVDAITGTDGVAALGGQVGRFPNGLIVAQDDVDTEGETASTRRARQNFKLVDWREVRRALAF
jgi:3-phytase